MTPTELSSESDSEMSEETSRFVDGILESTPIKEPIQARGPRALNFTISEISRVPEHSNEVGMPEAASTPTKIKESNKQPKAILHKVKKQENRKSSGKSKTIKEVILDALKACSDPDKEQVSYIRIKKYASNVGIKDMKQFREDLKEMLADDLVHNVTGKGITGSFVINKNQKRNLRNRK